MYFLFLKKYLFKHRRVHTSTKKDLLQVFATSSFDLSRTKYKLSTILAKENEEDCQDQLINRLFNPGALFLFLD